MYIILNVVLVERTLKILLTGARLYTMYTFSPQVVPMEKSHSRFSGSPVICGELLWGVVGGHHFTGGNSDRQNISPVLPWSKAAAGVQSYFASQFVPPRVASEACSKRQERVSCKTPIPCS